ncbi:MAG: hypothetical protein R3300_18770, partial [Candidatus Promineifilaceae bacterium]|nr:hypothetical protein [Candidatus Promineifilaceae bacterium]
MNKQRIQTGDAPSLTIDCLGDLSVRGWAEPAVLISGEQHRWSDEGKHYHLHCPGDLSLMVPAAATLQIDQTAGDLAVRNVTGPVTVADVMGDVIFQNLGPTEAQRVH